MIEASSLAPYADNPIVWAILLLGFSSYTLLLNFLCGSGDEHWRHSLRSWLRPLAVMLSALPLLGLLGTIMGLMRTFRELAAGAGLDRQVYLSSGISDALITTQLGLVLVIPGLVLLAWLKSRYREREGRHA